MKTAGRVICGTLRQQPYQRGVTITTWDAIIDQRLDDKRYGAFSWQNAISKEVRRYIGQLDEATKRTMWESTENAELIPNADLGTITECLYPFVCDAVNRLIHREIVKRQREREAHIGLNPTVAPRRLGSTSG